MTYFPRTGSTPFVVRSLLTGLLILTLIGWCLSVSNAQRLPLSTAQQPSPVPHLSSNMLSRLPNNQRTLVSQKTVRFVYLVPADSVVKPAYVLSIKNAARHLQQWYRDQLGDNLSFHLTDDVVEVHQSTHPSSWYATAPDGAWAGQWQFWFNFVNDALSLSGGTFEDADNFWVVYVDSFAGCGQLQGGGLNQVAGMGADDLRGLLGLPNLARCGETATYYGPCRYVGGLGHELGHAFGLPHPPGCDDGQPVTCDYASLMYLGYIDYPATYFSATEKAALRASPYIDKFTGANCPIDCAALNNEYTLSSSVSISICAGQTYFAGGALQTTEGTYVDRLRAKGGCDSVVTTHLTILPNYNSNRSLSLCQGESIFVGGSLQTTSGTYVDVFHSRSGCDSVVSTQLTILPKYAITKKVSICQGQTYFAGGAMQTTAGAYVDRLTSKGGCDSVVTTQLAILPKYAITKSVSICQGQTYFAGGAMQTTAGAYVDRLTSKGGCDSVVSTQLTILPKYAITKSVSICQGQTYFAGGAMQTTAGAYIDRLTSKGGCDSVVTTQLAVVPKYAITKKVSICQGQTYFAGGAMQTTAGAYVDRLTSKGGCDSVVTTQLAVVPKYTTTKNVSICPGETYFAGGILRSVAGTYRDVFVSKAGCDSAIVTNLSIRSVVSVSRNVSICDGDTYFAGGQIRNQSGTYTDLFKTKYGCDSTVTTHLSVVASIQLSKNVSICAGKSYLAGGSLQTTAGVYRDVYASSLGCDSIVVVNLVVLPAYERIDEVSTCDGDPYFAGGALQTSSGTYRDVFSTRAGCDSVVVTKLVVGICTAVVPEIDPLISVYPTPSNGTLFIEAALFDHALLLDVVGRCLQTTKENYFDMDALPNGTYYVKVYEDPKRYVIRKVILAR